MRMAMRTCRKIYGSQIPRSICGAYRKFIDTHIENGHFLCVYARAGEEITILRSIYADRKPLHRKPSHAKEKTLQTILRVYAYTLRSQRNHSLRELSKRVLRSNRKPLSGILASCFSKIKTPNKYCFGNQTKFSIFPRNYRDCTVVDPYKARKRYTATESLDLIVSVK